MKIIKHLKFAGLAAMLLFQTSITRADDNEGENRDHRNATITWTKYVPAFLPPGGDIFATIAGTAGGDIGEGTVSGDAFNPREVLPNGSGTFEAEYRFVGSKHSCTVHFRTVQTPERHGVIIGVVTEGWLKGNVVVGEYQGYPCGQGVAGCFDGTFVIKRGTKDND